ncbi:MAG: Ig-like domain-containing protein [Citrobacter sp.]
MTLTPDITTATVSMVTETTGGARADNVSTNTLRADNVSTNTLTATVEDVNWNRVPNATVDWGVTTGIATLSSAISSTDGNGQITLQATDITAESITVSAIVNNSIVS